MSATELSEDRIERETTRRAHRFGSWASTATRHSPGKTLSASSRA